MTILYYCAGDDQGRQLAALREALPDSIIHPYPYNGDKSLIRDAIVWQPPDDFFDDLVSLRCVYSLAAGVESLLNHPRLSTNIPIVRLHDAGMGVKMEEYVLYGVLHAHRQFPLLQQAQRDGRWAHNTRTPSAKRVHVGILGAGALGGQVAVRLFNNGYSVSCWSRTPRKLPEGIKSISGQDNLTSFLKPLSVLVCLLPLTPETQGLMNAELFAKLPDGAYLINPGRGAHLVESDLLAALDSGKVGGALLDVFCEEPLPSNHPFWEHEKIIITPHLAAPTPIRESTQQIADSMEVMRKGKKPAGLVDRNRGY